jgi:hypothetical protein
MVTPMYSIPPDLSHNLHDTQKRGAMEIRRRRLGAVIPRRSEVDRRSPSAFLVPNPVLGAHLGFLRVARQIGIGAAVAR